MLFVGNISGVPAGSILETSGTNEYYSVDQVPWSTAEPTEIVFSWGAGAPTATVEIGCPLVMYSGWGIIDWGDGTTERIFDTPLVHQYLGDDPTQPHTYNIKLWGQTKFGPNVPPGYKKNDISSVVTWGNIASVTFDGRDDFVSIPATPPTGLIEPFWRDNVFRDAGSFNDPNIVNYVSLNQPTSLREAFKNAGVFNQDISGLDVSQCTDFQELFVGANSFDQNLSGWNMSSAEILHAAFASTSFNNGGDPGIENWDVSNVSDFSYIFGISNSFNQPLTNWDTTGATSLEAMFINGAAFNNSSLNNWNTSHITDMEGMFNGAAAFNQDISGWDVSNVTNMDGMFNASPFDKDLGNWNLISGAGTTSMTQWWGPSMSDASLVGCMIGWNNNPNTPTGISWSGTPITISFGTYPAGKAAYDNLVLATGSGGKGWSISGITWTP